jgi:hypothetical protein
LIVSTSWNGDRSRTFIPPTVTPIEIPAQGINDLSSQGINDLSQIEIPALPVLILRNNQLTSFDGFQPKSRSSGSSTANNKFEVLDPSPLAHHSSLTTLKRFQFQKFCDSCESLICLETESRFLRILNRMNRSDD